MPTTLRGRALALFAPVFLFAATFALPAAAGGSSHPYFDDQGTLTWYHSLADAQRAAEREGKLIFIEYGRRACTQCKVLCARILPHPSIRGRLGRVAVGLAAECDRPEPAVRSLLRRNLRNARMLPFAGFVTQQGRWITGFAGSTSVTRFERHLALAERALARRKTPRAPREPQAPAPVRPPEPTPPADCAPPRTAPEDPCCPNGVCSPDHTPHIKFRPPPFLRQPSNDCPPCPEPAPITDAAEPDTCTFPPPAPLSEQPTSADLAEAPLAPAVANPNAAAQRALPAPMVRRSKPHPAVRRSPVTGYGDPDGDAPDGPAAERFASPSQSAREAALAAAERGEWGDVIRHTRIRAQTDPELRRLNYRAHAWAHGQLASAVRLLRERRYGDARLTVARVQTAMQGEPEAIDANRGAEAIELMQDLQPLGERSAARLAIRKNAYERLRGSRWAPLFSECPTPSRALSSR